MKTITTSGVRQTLPGMNTKYRAPNAEHRAAATVLSFMLLWAFKANSSEIVSNNVAPPRFLGAQGCSSSSCHGGAGEKNNQYTIWSSRDFHHARPYATLE